MGEGARDRRRLYRNLLLAAAGTIAGLLALALIAPGFVDWTAYRDRIAAMIGEATGREVTISGEVTFRLLPAPAFSAEGVTVANLPQGQAAHFAQLERLDLLVALLPLLRGDIRIERLDLIAPEIFLERYADGGGNWEIRESGDSRPEQSVAIDAFSVRRGRLTYSDPGAARSVTLTDLHADLSAQSLSGPFRLSAAGETDGLPFRLALRIDRFEPGRRVPVNVEIAAGGASLSYIGWLLDGEEMLSAAGRVTLESDSVEDMLALLDRVREQAAAPVTAPEGSVELAADLTFGEALRLDDLHGHVGPTRLEGSLSLELAGDPRLALDLRAGRLPLDVYLGVDAAFEEPAWEAFLPPPDWTLDLALAIEAMDYRGATINRLRFTAAASDGAIPSAELRAQLPGAATLHFAGGAALEQGAPRLAGDLRVGAGNLRALLAWLGEEPDLPPDRLVGGAVTTRISLSPRDLALEDLDLRIDDAAIRGDMSLSWAGERPLLDLSLDLGRFDLDAYLPRPDPAPPPRSPMDLARRVNDLLRQAEPWRSRIRLAAERLTFAGADMAGIDLSLASDGAAFAVESARATDIYGLAGTLAGRLEAGSETPAADLFLRAEVRDAKRLPSVFPEDFSGILDAAVLEGTLAGTVEALNVDWRVTAGGGRLEIAGDVAGALSESPGPVDLRLALQHPSHRALAERLNLSALDAGDPLPVRLSGEVRGGADAISLDVAGELLGGQVSIEGEIESPAEAAGIGATLTVSHDSLVRLLRQFKPDYAPSGDALGPVAVRARLTGPLKRIGVETVDAQVGPSRIGGTLLLDRTGPRPRFEATLSADTLPIDAFLAEPRGGTSPAHDPGDLRWSRKPFDPGALTKIDGTLTLEAGEARWAGYPVSDLGLVAVLADGVLDVTDLQGELFGGRLTLEGSLDAREKPAIQTAFELKDADLEALLARFAGLRVLAGRAELSGNLSARGAHAFAMASGLDGRLRLTAQDGSIEGLDLARLVRTAAEIRRPADVGPLLRAVLSGGRTAFSSLDADIVVKEGRMSAPAIRLRHAAGEFRGTLALDLAAWIVDGTGSFILDAPAGAPPIGVATSGNFSAPRLVFDESALRAWLVRRAAENAFRRLPWPETAPRVPEVVGSDEEKAAGEGTLEEERKRRRPGDPP